MKRGFPLGPRYVVMVGNEVISARPGSLYRAGILLEQLVKRGQSAFIVEVEEAHEVQGDVVRRRWPIGGDNGGGAGPAHGQV